MTIKSSVSMREDQHAFARALVRDGRFASVSAVVQQGLDLLRQKAETESLEREALRQLLAERQAGSFVAAPEMAARVEAMLRRKRTGNGLAD